jgi:predicted secreted protein
MEPNPKNISVRQGETFEVRLSSIPSTGYTVRVGNLPDQLELLDSKFEEGSQKSPLPGAPVTQVFRFRALHPGHAQITFESKRSWETTPAQTSVVQVDIT